MFWRASKRIRDARRRGFFVFEDETGQQHVADPFLVFRRFANHDTINLEEHAKAADAGEEPQTTELIEALVEIFGVARFDPRTGEGMSDAEIITLLYAYQAFLEEVKKNIDTGSTSSEPTESTSSATSTEARAQTTEGSSLPSGPNGSE